MDQIKIGRFIAECRKKNNLTQIQLAERLGITDRAISKWENGKSMPDASLMLDLCEELRITVNDLLSGEIITSDHYTKELEHNLLEMIKQKEQADKRLLDTEIVTGIVCIFPLLAALIITLTIPLEEPIATAITLASIIPLLFATPFMLRIEQKAGYYVCQKCNHIYVPSYKRVFIAAHTGRTRFMKCPNCGQRSWHRKILRKNAISSEEAIR